MLKNIIYFRSRSGKTSPARVGGADHAACLKGFGETLLQKHDVLTKKTLFAHKCENAQNSCFVADLLMEIPHHEQLPK